MSRKAKREYNFGRVVLTVLVVLGLALFTSKTVLSQTKEGMAVDEAGLRILEQEYVSEIRTYLEMQGFQNSGVTLTWVMEEDGSRSYEVLIYHKNINKLSEVELEQLLVVIESFAFKVNGCYFQVNLLV